MCILIRGTSCDVLYMKMKHYVQKVTSIVTDIYKLKSQWHIEQF